MTERTSNKRELYRISYPDDARPRFTAFAQEFEVVDCSEAGLRYSLNGAPPPASQSISGQIRFAAGATTDISGFVLRTENDLVALKFAKAISGALIMGEQRWLREHNAKQRAEAAKPARVQQQFQTPWIRQPA